MEPRARCGRNILKLQPTRLSRYNVRDLGTLDEIYEKRMRLTFERTRHITAHGISRVDPVQVRIARISLEHFTSKTLCRLSSLAPPLPLPLFLSFVDHSSSGFSVNRRKQKRRTLESDTKKKKKWIYKGNGAARTKDA